MTLPRILLCKASAGSGKTFTLAKSFIRILLERPHEYDRILAVTFTNKATEEMKSRILKFLTEISRIESEEQYQKSVIARVLLAELPGWDYRKLAAEAGKALGNILHDYGHFSVMTLDSFFQKMIRAFIMELKLPNAANPSLDIDQALDSAVAALMDSYDRAEDKALNQWLREMALGRLEDGVKWQPADMVHSLSRQLFNERISQIDIHYPIEKVAPFYQQLKQVIKDFQADLKHLVTLARDLITAHGIPDSAFSAGHLPKQLQKMGEHLGRNEFSETIEDAIRGGRSPFPKKVQSAPGFAAIDTAWHQDIQPALMDILELFETRQIEVNTAKAILKHLQSLALLSEVSEKIKEYRDQEGVMLISDNGQLIQEIIRYSDTPFLYEKLGNRYRYILLDEFQDTSTLQWNNLLPLITEVLAHRDQCQVMIVGDAKQSIYRWRNGNLKLILGEVKSTLHQHWKEDSEMVLERNFRSLKEIVRFNNDLFPPLADLTTAYIINQYDIQPDDDPFSNLLRQLFHPEDTVQDPAGKEGGYVEGRFFPARGRNDPPEEIDARAAYLQKILKDLLEEQGFRYGDITLLVRNNREAVQLAGMLSGELGYPVLTADGLLFNHHQVIQVLLSALKVVCQPEERLFRAELVHRVVILKNLGACSMEDRAVEDWLKTHLPALAQLSDIRRLQSLSLSDLVQALMGILELTAFRSIYTEQFLDIIAQYQASTSGTGVGAFLEWWWTKERSVTLSGEADAIQIVTVHKSKGLEFNVVIIPSLDWLIVETGEAKQALLWSKAPEIEPFNTFDTYPISFNSAAGSHFEDGRKEEAMMQAADNLNLLYVAFTRPVERLYFMAEVAKEEAGRFEKPSTIGKLLFAELMNHQPHAFEELRYVRGTPLARESEEQEDALIISEAINLDVLPVQELPPLAYTTTYESMETKLGEIIHDIAARYQSNADLKALASGALLSKGLRWDLLPELEARLRRFFSEPAIMNIYQSEERYPERELFHEGELLRTDLLVKQKGQWKLYDFKTGAVRKQYREQLEQYRKALSAAGMSPVESALIYIGNDGSVIIDYL
jgi:ATP-dependent helicase/nuclease subunit A